MPQRMRIKMTVSEGRLQNRKARSKILQQVNDPEVARRNKKPYSAPRLTAFNGGTLKQLLEKK